MIKLGSKCGNIDGDTERFASILKYIHVYETNPCTSIDDLRNTMLPWICLLNNFDLFMYLFPYGLLILFTFILNAP